MSIERVIVDLIEGKRHSRCLQALLYLLSLIYHCLVKVRNALYDWNLSKTCKSVLPVVSVGNLVAGGTGKTPFVQKLIREVSKIPGQIAVLSRGYRSQAEASSVLASCGEGPLTSVDLCGDEAYWLALTTKASVWVGKNRRQNIPKIEKTQALLILLEDGFQHRKIERDIDIVLLSAKDLFGKGFFLPRGYLRESPKSLIRADLIVVTHLTEKMDLRKIEQSIRRYSSAPLIGFSSRYGMNESFKGKKIGAFSGIAKPDAFYEALQLEGANVVHTLTLLDHKTLSLEELSFFALQCQKLGAEAIFCTEKDRVKLPQEFFLDVPIEVLSMELICTWNENVWKEMVHSLQTRMKK
jgi:tetraacyldisaccharide 4'-kinase